MPGPITYLKKDPCGFFCNSFPDGIARLSQRYLGGHVCRLIRSRFNSWKNLSAARVVMAGPTAAHAIADTAKQKRISQTALTIADPARHIISSDVSEHLLPNGRKGRAVSSSPLTKLPTSPARAMLRQVLARMSLFFLQC